MSFTVNSKIVGLTQSELKKKFPGPGSYETSTYGENLSKKKGGISIAQKYEGKCSSTERNRINPGPGAYDTIYSSNFISNGGTGSHCHGNVAFTHD